MKKLIPTLVICWLAFELSMGQCPQPSDPLSGDDCASAPLLCINLDGYCGSSSGTLNYPGTPTTPGCPSPTPLANDQWLAFIAGTSSISIQFSWGNCTPGPGTNFCGMEFELYEGSCGGPIVPPAVCLFYPYSPQTVTYPNLTVGQTYYLLINAFLPTINYDFSISVVQGSTQYDIPQLEGIAGPDQVCIGTITEYSVSNSLPAGLVWTITPPGVGTFVGPKTGETVRIYWEAIGTAQLCATPTSPCYEYAPPPCLDITVNPIPAMDDPPDITVCGGDIVDVPFMGTGNPEFNWINSNTNIGLFPAGSNDISFTAAYVNVQQTAQITVTPDVNGCTGPSQTFSITLLPSPVVNQPPDKVVCAGTAVSTVFTGTAGAVFNWTNDNPAIGLPASGTGNLSFTAAGVSNQETATITVTPEKGDCEGIAQTFTIVVNPIPVVYPPANLTVCSGDPVFVNFNGTYGADFNWTNTNPGINLQASGSGDLDFFAFSMLPQSATITIMPVFTDGGVSCTGSIQAFTITVIPVPALNQPANITRCGGELVNVPFFGTPGAVFNWANSNPAIGLAASGTGSINFTAADVNNAQTATITVTPANGDCTGFPQVFTITIINCCTTLAGTIDTLPVTVCGSKPIPVIAHGDYVLGPGDSLRFVLYSDNNDPLGSIIAYSATPYFSFLPGVTSLDSTYYVAVIAGPMLPNDSIDTSGPCFSIFSGLEVRWASLPVITLNQAPVAMCRDGCADVVFHFAGTPPFQFNWLVADNGQVLFSKMETVDAFEWTVSFCPNDFGLLPAGDNLNFQVDFFADKYCSCSD